MTFDADSKLQRDWRRRLRTSIGITTGNQIAVAIAQVAIHVFLARFLGANDYGKYALALIVPAMAFQTLSLGLPWANAHLLSSREFSARSALRAGAIWLGAFAGSLLLLFLLLTSTRVGALVPGIEAGTIAIAFLVYVLVSLNHLIGSIQLGLEDYPGLARTSTGAVAIQSAAIIVLTVANRLSVESALCAFGASHLVTALVAICTIGNARSETSGRDSDKSTSLYLRRAFEFGMPVHATNLLNYFSLRADLLLVNFFLGPASAGIYALGVQMVERAGTATQGVATAILPSFSGPDIPEASKRILTPLISRTILSVNFAFGFILLLAAIPAVPWVFGREYGAARNVIAALIPGIAALGATRILVADLAARGRPILSVPGALLGLVVNLGVNFAVIPKFGLAGAAIASSVSYSLTAVVTAVAWARLTKQHPMSALIPSAKDLQNVLQFLQRFRQRGSVSQ